MQMINELSWRKVVESFYLDIVVEGSRTHSIGSTRTSRNHRFFETKRYFIFATKTDELTSALSAGFTYRSKASLDHLTKFIASQRVIAV